MYMENNLNNADAPVTKAGLILELGKFEEGGWSNFLSEQANVILEAVGETMEPPVHAALTCVYSWRHLRA